MAAKLAFDPPRSAKTYCRLRVAAPSSALQRALDSDAAGTFAAAAAARAEVFMHRPAFSGWHETVHVYDPAVRPTIATCGIPARRQSLIQGTTCPG